MKTTYNESTHNCAPTNWYKSLFPDDGGPDHTWGSLNAYRKREFNTFKLGTHNKPTNELIWT